MQSEGMNVRSARLSSTEFEKFCSCFTALKRYENKHEKALILTSFSLKYCGLRHKFLLFLVTKSHCPRTARCQGTLTVSSGLPRRRPRRLPLISSLQGPVCQRLVVTWCIVVYGVSSVSRDSWGEALGRRTLNKSLRCRIYV